MSDAAAQRQFSTQVREQMAAMRQKMDAKLKDRAVQKALRYLCGATGVDLKEVHKELGEGEDPLTCACRVFLPRTEYGKVGFYLPDMTPAKTFSTFLIKPRKASEKLESYLEEAMCIYSAEEYPIVGVIFLTADKKLFVYCNAGVVDQQSVTVVKFNKKTRFIYSLDGFCRALGLWRHDEQDDD